MEQAQFVQAYGGRETSTSIAKRIQLSREWLRCQPNVFIVAQAGDLGRLWKTKPICAKIGL
jgi:hypothetical protein